MTCCHMSEFVLIQSSAVMDRFTSFLITGLPGGVPLLHPPTTSAVFHPMPASITYWKEVIAKLSDPGERGFAR